MNVEESVRLLVKTGSYVLGEKEVKALVGRGEAKLVVLSKTKNDELTGLCESHSVPVIRLERTSMELGIVCGKPFPISVIGVVTEGDSEILSFRSQDA
jgi:large subunit ribosomal protein L30e